MEVVPLLPEETDYLTHWLADIGAGRYVDGYLFIVLPTEDSDLGMISKHALKYADNPQIIIARPNQPLRGLREVVAKIDALETLAQREMELWGPEGERHDEWDIEYDKIVGNLQELFKSVSPQPYAEQFNLVCYWRGEPRSTQRWADLEQLAEEAMAASFPKTPKNKDQIMTQSFQLKGLKAAWRDVINDLLLPDGPKILVAEKRQAHARLVRLLESIGILRRQPKPRIQRPDDPGAAEAWDLLLDFAKMAREAPQPLEQICTTLRSAPFGIGPKVLPLLFAAALRDDIRHGNLVLDCPTRQGEPETVPIDSTHLEKAFEEPNKYCLRYVDLTASQRRAIEGLLVAIAPNVPIPESMPELLEETKKQATLWWSNLPQHYRQTQQLLREVQTLRDEIIQPLCLPDANAHEILVDKLRQRLLSGEDWTRDNYTQAFREGLTKSLS
ncbi:MAG: hypothetical protein ACUVX8_04500 [Candidatus Zipacnadales bacterium]